MHYCKYNARCHTHANLKKTRVVTYMYKEREKDREKQDPIEFDLHVYD